MSAGWLFGVGALVTFLVAIGLALPVYGAILDGRYQAEHNEAGHDEAGHDEAANVLDLPTRQPGHRPAA